MWAAYRQKLWLKMMAQNGGPHVAHRESPGSPAGQSKPAPSHLLPSLLLPSLLNSPHISSPSIIFYLLKETNAQSAGFTTSLNNNQLT